MAHPFNLTIQESEVGRLLLFFQNNGSKTEAHICNPNTKKAEAG